MRVLYLAPGRDLSVADAGTTHTLNMVKALRERGVRVTLAAAKGPEKEAPEEFEFVQLVGGRLSRLTGVGSAGGAVADAARNADIIHERAEESGGTGVRLARLYRKPLILEINTPLSGYPNGIIRQIADWNLRRQARQAAAIITQTPLARNIIEEYSQRPVYVVPNGADPRTFSPAVAPKAVPGAEKDRRIVAFAGSLRPWHGVEDLVVAGPQILGRHPEAFILVVGGGPRERELQENARATLGAGNCHFTGAVRPDEVPGWLAAADVLVAPFAPDRDPVRRRQFARYGMWWSPVKIFEYMAMGKAIAASAAGMVPEYTAGAALIFAAGDVRALGDCVCRLLEDAQLAGGLARAARERLLANYTWQAAARQTIEVYDQFTTGRQKLSPTR